MKRIHLIAVCGMGMGSLAGLLKEKGFEVTGSDANIYPPMSDQLAALGIPIRIGYRRENIDATRPDLVVVGNAISKDNEEAQAALGKGIPLLSMPQALSEFFLKDRIPIVVAGTHGKTTTAGLLAWILDRLGYSPGLFVGGVLKNFGRSYQLGSGKYFVVEGDEYDSAFFDKGPKFLHYAPRILILNAVEFDHADIYRDLEHLLQSFTSLIGLMPRDGLIVADGENANVQRLVPQAPCRVITPDLSPNLSGEPIVKKDSIPLSLPGRHNLKNLLAAVAVLRELGIPLGGIEGALREFQGMKRRQEVLAKIRDITVIDDFAHHPTAVRETLAALRPRCQGKLWAIFEPRSNTTRRNVFQREFVAAFDIADEVILAPPYRPEKIPESERLDPQRLADDLKARGKAARYLPDLDEIVKVVSRGASGGDVVCFMSNGDFGGVPQKTVQKLAEMWQK